jgi:beta-glucosidase
LPGRQDELIEAVARANPRLVVVLETGGPVLMPWLDRARAVLEAWYPGQKGGEAIAEILCGAVDPSGRLPLTFPTAATQLPHPTLPGDPNGAPLGPVGRGGHYGAMFAADYSEGAAVGYKWFAKTNERPLFPFGFGLSYTTFSLRDLTVTADGDAVTASANVVNTGARAGAAVTQLYASNANLPLRLAGWGRMELQPGETRRVTMSVDPRLLAWFDESRRRWRIEPGIYDFTAGFDVDHRDLSAAAALEPASLPP